MFEFYFIGWLVGGTVVLLVLIVIMDMPSRYLIHFKFVWIRFWCVGNIRDFRTQHFLSVTPSNDNDFVAPHRQLSPITVSSNFKAATEKQKYDFYSLPHCAVHDALVHNSHICDILKCIFDFRIYDCRLWRSKSTQNNDLPYILCDTFWQTRNQKKKPRINLFWFACDTH